MYLYVTQRVYIIVVISYQLLLKKKNYTYYPEYSLIIIGKYLVLINIILTIERCSIIMQ